MNDYISRDAAKKQMRNGRHSMKWLLASGAKTIGDAFAIVLDEVPAADVRPVALCKDCVYAPSGTDDGEDQGFALEWPHDEWPEDNPCPCKCEGGARTTLFRDGDKAEEAWNRRANDV